MVLYVWWPLRACRVVSARTAKHGGCGCGSGSGSGCVQLEEPVEGGLVVRDCPHAPSVQVLLIVSTFSVLSHCT